MREVLLTEICDIQYGFAFDSALFSESEGVPLVRIRDVVRGFSETYTKEPFPAEYEVQDGDILIGMDGEFNIAKWNGGKAALNQRVCKLIPQAVDSGYIFYFMPIALKKIEEKTPFVTVKHLSAKELNKIYVPLPSMVQQKAIAQTLDKVNELISLRKKQLQKLDDLVKSRFVEMFAKHNERIVPLKTICIKGPQNGFYRKGAEINGTIPIMKMKQLFGNESMSEAHDCDLVALTKTELERFLLTQNDLLFGRRSLVVEGAGKCRRVGRITTQAVFESSMLRVTLDATKVKPRYLQIWFNSEEGKNAISSIRAVTTIAGIKGSDLANVEVPVAPIALQEEFLEFVGQCDRSKLTIQKSLDKLELLKQSLMQTYFGDK